VESLVKTQTGIFFFFELILCLVFYSFLLEPFNEMNNLNKVFLIMVISRAHFYFIATQTVQYGLQQKHQ